MKKVVSLFAALVVIAGLCVSCRTADKPAPEVPEQPQESTTKQWEPETAAPTKAPSAAPDHDHSDHDYSDHDHSGHDHSDHDQCSHDHGDHSGHNH